MSSFTRGLSWCGFGAGLGLCAVDFLTSTIGVFLILGVNQNNPITWVMPVLFGMLALCFNALSGQFVRMYREMNEPAFVPVVTLILWAFFLVYDVVSSFIGLLHAYTTATASSSGSVFDGLKQLGPLAGFFVTVMSVLLAFGPLLAIQFYNLATSQLGNVPSSFPQGAFDDS